jgi:HD-GYP domain-containing protein (c-di-GMP phosphodiesterase class II)
MMIEFERNSGYQFDPQVVDVLKGLVKNILPTSSSNGIAFYQNQVLQFFHE